MTVQELIATLQFHPPHARVVVRGYEDGVNIVEEVKTCRIVPFNEGEFWKGTSDYHNTEDEVPDYYGAYDIAKEGGEEAVFIRCVSRW
jgi:hypothetical protein